MLNKEGKENIQKIKNAAKKIWGDTCRFGKVEVLDAPFCMFNLPALMYEKYDIVMKYDRSILDIAVKIENNDTWLANLTTDHVIEGFESCDLENLLHNFKILDKVLRMMGVSKR